MKPRLVLVLLVAAAVAVPAVQVGTGLTRTAVSDTF
jgi:hypothetical protein